MVQIVETPIDIASAIARVSDPAAGGINIFAGTIRDFNRLKGKKVIRLEYEAYEPMAIAEMEKIAGEAAARFGVLRWTIVHRTGVVMPGETAVVVAVTTPHRQESFQACEFIINELKARVPIWKKEVMEDGEEWVSAHP